MAAKTTVSLDDELHEWASSQPDLNVSELLRTALRAERERRRIESSESPEDAAITRLRGHVEMKIEDRFPELFRAGKEYAAHRLSMDEITDIQGWYDTTDFDVVYDSGQEALDKLASLTDEFHDDPHGLRRDRLEQHLNGKRLTPRRVEAFVLGICWIADVVQGQE